MYNEAYLQHHGIKGQRWGVRRYRNYDGSYTKAGLKRYSQSLEKYEKADSRYKKAKNDYKINKKSGENTDGYKTELVNARMDRKNKKNRLDKDYKHLKQDKLADQGKDIYSKGITITGNNATQKIMTKIGTMSLSAAAFNNKTQIIGRRGATEALAAIGGITLTASAGIGIRNNYRNKRLRAYYSHTSNY